MFFLNIFQTGVRIRMLALFDTERNGKEVYIIIDRRSNPTSLASFKYKAAVNSGLLYTIASEISNNTVGYQYADAPDRITETIWGL